MTEPSQSWTTPSGPTQKSHTGRNIIIVLVVLLVAAIAFGACVAAISNAGKDAIDKAQKGIGSTTPAGDLIVITLDEFDQIQNGMTLQQVEDIVGGPGNISSSSQVGTSKLVNYQWAGEGLGDNAVIGFRDDRVFIKTQIGLGPG